MGLTWADMKSENIPSVTGSRITELAEVPAAVIKPRALQSAGVQQRNEAESPSCAAAQGR